MNSHTRFSLTPLVAVAMTVTLSGTAAADSTNYVALGDSYTAAPGLLHPAPGSPPLCTQSSLNYPHLIAQTLGYALTDRSCASATTQNMTTAQYPDQPPQFNSLTPSTKVVTIGIGGNDSNTFMDVVVACTATDAAAGALDIGTPCKSLFGAQFANNIAADAPVLGAAFAKIHVLAPHAKVFVIGYPDVLPQQGRCYPLVTLTTGDVAYVNNIEVQLNQVLRDQAAANGATYVDTYTPSVGHDVCTPESTRWVEPTIPGTLNSTPIHPNAAGEAADARDIEPLLPH